MKADSGPAVDRFRARATITGRVSLATIDPAATQGLKRKSAERAIAGWTLDLANLQDRTWAEQKKSVLIVLQGLDTSGKDGTVKHVMGDMNVQGVRVVAFKQPTPEEQKHDFLWRIKRHLPGPGEVVVFNRSHYEDVLIARVKDLAPAEEIEKRYEQINKFEADLVQGGTTVIKFMLHISPAEQKRRLLARLDDPTKRWKFNPNDLKERTLWSAYMDAYEIALTKCNPDQAPWYIVPADHKWYRNWVISAIMIERLKAMKPRYPDPRLDVKALRAELLSGNV